MFSMLHRKCKWALIKGVYTGTGDLRLYILYIYIIIHIISVLWLVDFSILALWLMFAKSWFQCIIISVYILFATESMCCKNKLLERKVHPQTSCGLGFLRIYIIIIIMNIYHALINALSAHMIHINLNMISYTHVEHSPTKTIYIKYY